ncbi:COG3650 family protein [Salinibacter altiplanensis]|uniref:COG3650 family protein n=1 Tax=Salinibacter altiplanensis TaxID=1803181 RepID=UPI001E48DD2C|nr:MliC family protein [Salinibacter altiplanensis]
MLRGKEMSAGWKGLRYVVGSALLEIVLLGGGCGGGQASQDATEMPLTNEEDAPARRFVVQCTRADGDGGTFRALVRPNVLVLRVPASFGGDTRRLRSVRAASGAKYEGDGAWLWSKGRRATVEIDGRCFQDCTLAPTPKRREDDRHPGLRFRATGQEPGWIVEVTEDRLRFAWAYAQHEVTTSQFDEETDGGRIVYEADTDRGPVRVVATPQYCTDPMSGRLFSHTVTVTLDGDLHAGCGHPTP